ncbi:hypothetical protein [Rhizobium leguminosarum]|uniref:hypothetical protein n=1 Tax=Rhizobium leguminosarum TaxID=384 RepID=UPI001FDFB9EB|nr:hypothetical protein [Rhizobium leguminosarum]
MLSNKDKELANRAKVMTDAFYAQNLLREAFPESRYGSVKGAIFAAYRFVRPKVSKELTPRRIRSIREGTARRIDAEEMEALNRSAQMMGGSNDNTSAAPRKLEVHVHGGSGDEHVRELARQGAQEALYQDKIDQTRGGFGNTQKKFNSRVG